MDHICIYIHTYVQYDCINMFKMVGDNGDSGLPSACLDHTGQVGLLLAPLVMSRHGSTIIFIMSHWLLDKAEHFERIVDVPEVTLACPWHAWALQAGSDCSWHHQCCLSMAITLYSQHHIGYQRRPKCDLERIVNVPEVTLACPQHAWALQAGSDCSWCHQCCLGMAITLYSQHHISYRRKWKCYFVNVPEVTPACPQHAQALQAGSDCSWCHQ